MAATNSSISGFDGSAVTDQPKEVSVAAVLGPIAPILASTRDSKPCYFSRL